MKNKLRRDVPLYDPFSADYDRFVNWEGRLAYELPFIEQQLTASGAQRVLDTACGTGMHAIALAQRGYDVTGADLSVGMIERARENAAAIGSEARFVAAGFGELANEVRDGFDALLCLGNSLPHVLTADALHATLTDFAAVLRPGGLLLIQNRNFDAIMRDRVRWMGPQPHHEGDREWLFIRFYDFNSDGALTFNILTLRRDGASEWTQQIEATKLRPLLHAELSSAIAAAGFGGLACYGDMTGAPFDPGSSGNLIVTARKKRLLDADPFPAADARHDAQSHARHAGRHGKGGAHAAAHEGADARPDAPIHGKPAAQDAAANHPLLCAPDGGVSQGPASRISKAALGRRRG